MACLHPPSSLYLFLSFLFLGWMIRARPVPLKKMEEELPIMLTSSSTSPVSSSPTSGSTVIQLHQLFIRRGRRLHQRAVVCLYRIHTWRGRRLTRHSVTIFINSSFGEDVLYLGAIGIRHDDIAIFFDLSLGKDADSTGTPPFFYSNCLHRVEVITVNATPRVLHQQACHLQATPHAIR